MLSKFTKLVHYAELQISKVLEWLLNFGFYFFGVILSNGQFYMQDLSGIWAINEWRGWRIFEMDWDKVDGFVFFDASQVKADDLFCFQWLVMQWQIQSNSLEKGGGVPKVFATLCLFLLQTLKILQLPQNTKSYLLLFLAFPSSHDPSPYIHIEIFPSLYFEGEGSCWQFYPNITHFGAFIYIGFFFVWGHDPFPPGSATVFRSRFDATS